MSLLQAAYRRAPRVRDWDADTLEHFADVLDRTGAAMLAHGWGTWGAADLERAAMYRAAALAVGA